MDDLRDFIDFAEELAGGFPDRPGPLFLPPPQLVRQSQSLSSIQSMLKRPGSADRRSRKRVRGSKPAATTVAKIVRRVALKTHELKEVVTSGTGAAFSGTVLNFYLINGLAQGVGGGQRIGRDTRNEFIDLRYMVNTNANVPEVCRVMIIYDKLSRGSAPVTADVLNNTSANFLHIANYNADNYGVRFKILYDSLVDQLPPTTTAIAARSRTARIKSALKTHYYDTATAGIAGIDAGALYFCYASYTTASSTITFDISVKYRDI